MRYSLAMLLLAGAVGCGDFEEAMNTERKPVSPPGIAPVEDMAGDNIHNPPNANGVAAQPAIPPPQQGNIIGKVDAKVVDKKAALAENPNLVVVENKLQGNDPISLAGSAYVSMSSRISLLNFENNMKIWKASNDNRSPSYGEFMQLAKDLSFARLPPYQMYGYDEETGLVVILEDKAEKKRRYEAAGIPWDE